MHLCTDYDVSTLQSELEQTLNKLSKNLLNYKFEKFKVIFVIDELDKLETDLVIDVIKSLKMLFNQTSALFVLITGQEMYDRILNESKSRGKEYTLLLYLFSTYS